MAAAHSIPDTSDEGRADRLTEAIRRAHDLMLATHAHLLELIAVFDREGLWETDGASSMGDWLAWTLGISARTGNDWARTARRVHDLPEISDAMAQGDLSYDQTRVLARFVPQEADGDWADEGPRHSVAELERIAAQQRPRTAQDSQEAHARRRLDVFWDHETGIADLDGRLPEDDAQTVTRALERVVESMIRDDPSCRREGYRALMADALVELAGTYIASDTDPDRATVLVQVPAGGLCGDDTQGAWLHDGPPISAETARRLACDSRYQTVAHDEHGTAIGVGRMQRSIPPAVSRIVRTRDITCRWPGCTRTRRLHVHHVIFWGHGGPTDTHNLACLCPRHHRLVHEGHYRMSGNANEALTFTKPDNRAIGQTRPPPR